MKHYEKARERIKSGMSQIVWEYNSEKITSFKIEGKLINGEKENNIIYINPYTIQGIISINYPSFDDWILSHPYISHERDQTAFKITGVYSVENFKVRIQEFYDEWLLFQAFQKDKS